MIFFLHCLVSIESRFFRSSLVVTWVVDIIWATNEWMKLYIERNTLSKYREVKAIGIFGWDTRQPSPTTTTDNHHRQLPPPPTTPGGKWFVHRIPLEIHSSCLPFFRVLLLFCSMFVSRIVRTIEQFIHWKTRRKKIVPYILKANTQMVVF